MKYSRHAILEVDLQALKDNVSFFKTKIKPQTKLMGMVKADAYGLGAVKISKYLESFGIEYLAVAYSEEALELRKNGVTCPIMVLNTNLGNYKSLIESNVEPSIFTFRILNSLTEDLIKNNIAKAFPIHIKYNSGMNRLGFGDEDISELIRQLSDNPYVSVKSIFSHLAVSDEISGEEFTMLQAKKFSEFCDKLSFNLGYEPMRHIANSAAIIKYPDLQMDMVRLGIGMYGISMTEGESELKNVVTLKAFISQIRWIGKHETVSYGRRFKAERQSKIAVISLGYADGVHRSLGNGKGKVVINGKEVPIIGTICMDMFMVDVTDIECNEGDEVIVFGNNPDLHFVAEKANTIPYEIITSVSPRVQRVYLFN